MMRFVVFGFAIGLPLLAASSATAQLIVYDAFDYTVGSPIIGQTNPGNVTATPAETRDDPWFDPSFPAQPTGAADTQVIVSESVSYPGLAAASGKSLAVPREPQSNYARINMPLPAGAGSYNAVSTNPGYVGTDGLYFSFTMKLTNFNGMIGAPATVENGGGFLAGFQAGPFLNGNQNGMGTAASFGGQLRLRREVVEDALTGNYQFGIVVNNGANEPPLTDWAGGSYAVEEEVLVVGNYIINGGGFEDDVVKLWINPTPGEAEAAPSVTSQEGPDVQLGGFNVIRSFWFRSDGLSPGDFLVDELRIGQTWADVTPAGATVQDGDFNGDGFVDALDYVVWRADGNTTMTDDDYALWAANYGGAPEGGGTSFAVPEPSTVVGLWIASITWVGRRRARGAQRWTW